MTFIQIIATQFAIALYQMTSFQVGSTSLAQISAGVQDYLANSELVFLIKLVAGMVSVGLLVTAAFLLVKMRELNRKAIALRTPLPSEPATAGPLQNRWAEILRHIDSTHEGEWKYAVIEADTITDDQLKSRFVVETMGERLMGIDKTKLLTIDGIWEAHKIRNRLAHDTNYFLRHAEAVRAIKLYEATLKELEVL